MKKFIKKIICIFIVGWSLLMIICYMSKQFHFYKDIIFEDGTYYLYKYKNQNTQKYQYALKSDYENTVILYNVNYYKESRDNLYFIGTRTEDIKLAYVIINIQKQNYRIYDSFEKIPEDVKEIFENKNDFNEINSS